MRKLDEYDAITRLLASENIRTVADLSAFGENNGRKISELETQRNALRNKLRREKSPEEEERLKARIHNISSELRPLRQKQKTAAHIAAKYPEAMKNLEAEWKMENGITPEIKNRGIEHEDR